MASSSFNEDFEKKMSPSEKDRYRKRDKAKKMKRKKKEKECHLENEYDTFMNSFLPKDGDSISSPHLIISRQFYKIEKPSIYFKDHKIVGDNNERKIFSSLDKYGEHVRMYGKSKYKNIDINRTEGNTVFLVVHLKYMEGMKHLTYFTEKGSILLTPHNDFSQDGYVLLATIKFNQDWKDMSHIFTPEDFNIIKSFCNNQIRGTSKGYHFGTSGEIYSFGYTPTYSKNLMTGHSVNRYADSKLNYIFSNISFKI